MCMPYACPKLPICLAHTLLGGAPGWGWSHGAGALLELGLQDPDFHHLLNKEICMIPYVNDSSKGFLRFLYFILLVYACMVHRRSWKIFRLTSPLVSTISQHNISVLSDSAWRLAMLGFLPNGGQLHLHHLWGCPGCRRCFKGVVQVAAEFVPGVLGISEARCGWLEMEGSFGYV